jgi:hypothetical protein
MGTIVPQLFRHAETSTAGKTRGEKMPLEAGPAAAAEALSETRGKHWEAETSVVVFFVTGLVWAR